MGTFGRKVTVTAFSALLAALFALGGCTSGQQAQSSASASSSASTAASSSASATADADAGADLVIGEQASGSAHVMLTNETGLAIDGIAFEASGSTDTVVLEPSGQAWSDGQTASVYFEAQGSGVYDIEVMIADTTHVLHDFDVELVSSAAIHLEGDVAYVTYEQFGNEVNTLGAETELAEAAAAEAEAAAAQAAADQAGAASNPPASSQPAQSGDSCVDGGVVLR